MIKRLLLAITAAGLLLAGFAPSSHAANDGYSTRIIGGSAIPITDAPWQVALIIDNSHLCGGSLIRDDWIVTAAHCMDGVVSAGQVRYAAGQANYVTATYSPVAQVIVHPLYSTQTQANDIALIRLPAPVTVSASIDTIALPVDESKASPLTWPVAMQPATVTGWGRTQNGGAASPTLQGASLFVLTSPSDSTCGSWGANYSKSTMLCGGVPNGSIDTCYGDSGGPLWVSVAGSPTLAGLTSFGLDSGCADAGYPGVYTRVTHYIDWILTNVGVTTTPRRTPKRVSDRWCLLGDGVLG